MTKLLNVCVTSSDYSDVLHRVSLSVLRKTKIYICVAAAHLMVECQANPSLLRGVNRLQSLVMPDGMPLVWLLRLYGYKQASRVYGPTLMIKLCSLAAQNSWGVFLLGGAVGQSRMVALALHQRFRALRIVGYCDTPARPIPPHHNQKTIGEINNARPKIVFVGLGCPHQELWMISNRKRLDAPILIGVGAAFDFLSSRVRQAPEWVQNIGLEWLFRFVQEPRRLWYRYTVVNAIFVWLVVKQLLCERRSST